MQPLTADPRTQYTPAQITALLTAPDLAVDYGCELLTPALALVADISADVASWVVKRDNLANVHGTVDLTITPTTYPIPTLDPATLAGKRLWLRAKDIAGVGGTAVASWADQSGLGFNGTAAGTSPTVADVATPAGGKAIQFSGAGNFAFGAVVASGPAEIWAVVRAEVAGVQNGLWSWNAGTSATAHSFYPYVDGRVIESFGVANTLNGPTDSVTQWRIYRVVNDGTNLTTYLDGVQKATATVASLGGAQWGTNVLIGKTVFGTTSSAFFTGKIAEVLVRGQLSTPKEVADITDYLTGEHFTEGNLAINNNLIDAESSTFEGGTVGAWGNGIWGRTACTIANSVVRAKIGTKSMLITWPTAGAGGTGCQYAIPVTLGHQYTFTVWVYVPTGSPAVRLGELFGQAPASPASNAWDGWQQLLVAFKAASTGTYFFGVDNVTAATAGQQAWVDEFFVRESTGAVKAVRKAPLAWGAARVRPYQLLTSATAGVSNVRFNEGVFLLTSPATPLAETPVTYAVTGFDQLHLLQAQIGDSYPVASGSNVLTAVRAALTSAGIVAPVLLDSSASAAVLSSDMVFPLTSSESPTWLQVVNKLLAAVYYRGIWCDWNGAFVSGPYVNPTSRPSEYTFAVGDLGVGVVASDRSVVSDVWNAPNRWTGIRNGLTAAPTPGVGSYTTDNKSTGLSSQDSVGRVIPVVIFLDAVDQASLVSQVDAIKATAMRTTEVITAKVGPMPILWHVDIYTWSDPVLGADRKSAARSWSLNSDGSDGDLILETVV